MNYPIVVTGDQLRDAIDLLVEGLINDSGHHKQWYIEQALESLDVNLDELKIELALEDYEWEPGIAP